MRQTHWKVHFKSAPGEVYRALSTPLGRSRYWAESAKEAAGTIHFVLPDGRADDSRIEQAIKDERYVIRYFGRLLTFALSPDPETGGTDLTLTYDEPHPFRPPHLVGPANLVRPPHPLRPGHLTRPARPARPH